MVCLSIEGASDGSGRSSLPYSFHRLDCTIFPYILSTWSFLKHKEGDDPATAMHTSGDFDVKVAHTTALNLHTIQLCVLYQLDRHFAPNDRRAKFHVFRVLFINSTQATSSLFVGPTTTHQPFALSLTVSKYVSSRQTVSFKNGISPLYILVELGFDPHMSSYQSARYGISVQVSSVYIHDSIVDVGICEDYSSVACSKFAVQIRSLIVASIY